MFSLIVALLITITSLPILAQDSTYSPAQIDSICMMLDSALVQYQRAKPQFASVRSEGAIHLGTFQERVRAIIPSCSFKRLDMNIVIGSHTDTLETGCTWLEICFIHNTEGNLPIACIEDCKDIGETRFTITMYGGKQITRVRTKLPDRAEQFQN